MISQTKNQYNWEIVREQKCDVPYCDHDHTYSVRTMICEKKQILGIEYNKTFYDKYHCPEHTNIPEAREEAMKKEAKNQKRNKNKNEFNKILSFANETIPVFEYKQRRQYEERLYVNDQTSFSLDGYENAESFLNNSHFNTPVLLYEPNVKYTLILPDDTLMIHSILEDDISFVRFEQTISDYETNANAQIPIITNNLTGYIHGSKVEDLTRVAGIDRIEKFGLSKQLQPDFNLSYCPVCHYETEFFEDLDLTYSKVTIRAEEQILATHTRCNQIIGHINPVYDLTIKR